MYDILYINSDGIECRNAISVRDILKVSFFEESDLGILDEKSNFRISSIVTKKDRNYIILKLDFIRSVIFKEGTYLFQTCSNEFRPRILELSKGIGHAMRSHHDKALELVVLETIFKHTNKYFSESVETIKPGLVSLIDDVRQRNYNNRTKKRLVDLQSQQIDLLYKIRDIKEMLG